MCNGSIFSTNMAVTCKRHIFHSFITLAFPLGRVAGQQSLKDSKYLTINSNLREFCLAPQHWRN